MACLTDRAKERTKQLEAWQHMSKLHDESFVQRVGGVSLALVGLELVAIGLAWLLMVKTVRDSFSLAGWTFIFFAGMWTISTLGTFAIGVRLWTTRGQPWATRTMAWWALGLQTLVFLPTTVLIGAFVVSRVREDWRARSQRADTWHRFQANDPTTVASCVLRCDLPRQLDPATDLRAAAQVIAWWGANPQPTQMPVLMVAYLKQGRALLASDPTQAETYLRQAAILAADPRVVPALDSPEFGARRYNDYYYNDIAEGIQSHLMVLRYRGIPGRSPELGMLKDRCQAVAAWPPAWMTTEVAPNELLKSACFSAHLLQFGAIHPESNPSVVDGIIDPVSEHRHLPQEAVNGHL